MELVTVKIEILSYRPHGLNTKHCWEETGQSNPYGPISYKM